MKIEQDFKYQGDHWWKWSVWIEASDDDLDGVDHVVYILHPSFPNPIRTVKDRASKFRLEMAGWGVFDVHAKVVSKNGQATKLTHPLTLCYPDGTPTTL
jgi:transcription initiation factor IIF auxiliary subunit